MSEGDPNTLVQTLNELRKQLEKKEKLLQRLAHAKKKRKTTEDEALKTEEFVAADCKKEVSPTRVAINHQGEAPAIAPTPTATEGDEVLRSKETDLWDEDVTRRRRSGRLTSKRHDVESEQWDDEEAAVSRALIATTFECLVHKTKTLSMVDFSLPEEEYPLPKRPPPVEEDTLPSREDLELAALSWEMTQSEQNPRECPDVQLSGDKPPCKETATDFNLTSSPVNAGQDHFHKDDICFRFITCIKSSESVENIQTSPDGRFLVVRRRTQLNVWCTRDNRTLVRQYHAPEGGTLMSSCALDDSTIVLLRRESGDCLVRLPLDTPEVTFFCLGYISCTEPLLCPVGGSRFACCTKEREDSNPVLVARGGQDADASVSLETSGLQSIDSICCAKNLDAAIVGTCNGQMLLWNSWTGRLVGRISTDISCPERCLNATSEEDLLFCLLASENKTCRLIAFNPVLKQHKQLITYHLDENTQRVVDMGDGLHFATTNERRDVEVWNVLYNRAVAALPRLQPFQISALHISTKHRPSKFFVGYGNGCVHIYSGHTPT